MKSTRFYIAISLLVQSITFIVMFIALFIRKRSLSGAILAVAAVGGAIGSLLLCREFADSSRNPKYMYGDMYDDDYDMTSSGETDKQI